MSKAKAIFSVQDTGIGIPPEGTIFALPHEQSQPWLAELENIFARFHRVQNQGRSQEGSGIGLALTRVLARVKQFLTTD